MPETTQPPSEYLTIDAVRNYILDRTIQDNQIDLDLAFSPEEITNAMGYAARAYASIPPFVGSPDASRLPMRTNVFLDATAVGLYIGRLSRLQRNDIDYKSGTVTVELEKKQIEYMKDMIKFHQGEFKEAAKALKVAQNLRRARGRIG